MRAFVLAAALMLCGCNQVRDLRTNLSSAPFADEHHEAKLKQNLNIAYEGGGFNRTPSDKDMLDFLGAGMSLSDYYCDVFFRQTNQSARKRRFTRNATNDVGGLMAAVLGLAKAGSGITGGTAAGFSLLDKTFRNYDESFMVDADLSKLRKLVLSAQDNMKTQIISDPPKNYFSAESKIIRYAGLCSFLGMQGLLNDSVTEKTDRIVAVNENHLVKEKNGRPMPDNIGNGATKGVTDTQAANAVTNAKPVAPLAPPN